VPEEKKYKSYSAVDIEKYQKGLLSPKEMNELEKAALDDPFLADALEGYAAMPINVSSDLAELKEKLDQRIAEKKVVTIAPSGTFRWWKVAAAAVILGGLGYVIFQISTANKNKEVATLEKKQGEPETTPVGDSNKFMNSPRDSALKLESNTPSASGDTKEIVTPRNQKGKSISKVAAHGETNKDDLATEMTRPSQPALNYKRQIDSTKTHNAVSGVSAPAAMEKRSTIGDEGYLSFKKEALSNNQQRTNYFNGRIKDVNNNPLPFANITITQNNIGTYADAQGRFTLVSPDSVLNVQVRSVGFEINTVQLKNSVADNEVVMQENNKAADRVLSYKKPDTSRLRTSNVRFEELEPADGWSNYNTYLANNINVPEDVKRKADTKGQVQLSFEVNHEGDPVNIRVEQSLCGKCDEEAIRVVRQGPKWKKKNKKAKRITISVPFDIDQ